jgi:peptidoglycan/LPS O-acetylase OafA/YrhL
MRQRVQPIDGLRALSVLWMIAFHCIFFLGSFVTLDRYIAILWSPAVYIPSAGHFGVDIFFVISGYLIAALLLREHGARGTISLKGFYIRRAFRILPAYLVALAATWAVLGDRANIQHVWENLLFINNFFPVAQQTMLWSWSLAIEEQFYLVFPLVLIALWRLRVSRRSALLWFSGLLAAGFALNFLLLRAYHIDLLPVPHRSLGEESFYRYFDGEYDKTYCRFGGILCGVIVAFLAENPELLRRLAANRIAARVRLGFCFAVLAFMTFHTWYIPPGQHYPAVLAQVFLASYRYIFAMIVGYLILHMLASEKPGLLARALGMRIWKPVANLSYGAYLLHPLVIVAIYMSWPVHTLGFGEMSLRIMSVYALTFAASYAMYRWFENPLRQVGRNLADSAARQSVTKTKTTSASGMTPSTNSANSPCATAADYTTPASDAPTPRPQS